MPYVRKEYIPRIPQLKISKFKLGKASDFNVVFKLVVKRPALIMQEALESARVSANKILEAELGENNYVLRVIPYPHIICREHKMLAMAGADRVSKGMKKAYGKPVTLAAKVEAGSPILEVYSKREYENVIKKGLRTAASKLPIETFVEKEELKKEGETGEEPSG
ncbi:MAG: 50S ribosomal protein L16 [Crenarchaeota archaeon]|nr:50S ribosomal protein L16 [Thermoproteota archaeon]MDW8034453.1 50S ribosomal protein L16 [Nitrososphaerota archaeon]